MERETSPRSNGWFRNRKAFAILFPATFGWFLTLISVGYYEDYGLVLFFGIPLFFGIASGLIYGGKGKEHRKTRLDVAYLTLGLYGAGLLLFALEGLICLIMAAPLGLLCTWIGYLIADAVLTRFSKNRSFLLLFSVILPCCMSFEDRFEQEEELRSATTSIIIHADAATVWDHIIEFPLLDAPEEWMFKAGIAYPVSAHIEGRGVGAIRYCNFSTGRFVEPITVWDPNRLLAFDVQEQPEPMKELSPYELHPKHLHGYWISRKGKFVLEQLSNGST